MSLNSYRDLEVWQRAINFCTLIYQATAEFPSQEKFGLTSQMCRASVAIASNIAEGQRRGHRQEYIQFLRISFGSGAELETQLEVAHNVSLLADEAYNQLRSDLEIIMKMLNRLITSLSNKQ